jgi:hypothetical protein
VLSRIWYVEQTQIPIYHPQNPFRTITAAAIELMIQQYKSNCGILAPVIQF